MIKVLIFDFFGVIRADGFKNWLFARGYGLTGAFLTATERNDMGEFTVKDFYQAISDASGVPAEQIQFEMEHDTALNRELVDYLATLHGSYKIALLTNSQSAYLRAELAKHDLEKHFDEIVISSEVGMIKPQPEIFQHILDKLGATPDECIFIDDNPRNTAGAESIGIHGIVYTDLPSLKTELQLLLA